MSDSAGLPALTPSFRELQEFVVGKVREGRPLAGTYPPDAATQAEYEVWRKARGV